MPAAALPGFPLYLSCGYQGSSRWHRRFIFNLTPQIFSFSSPVSPFPAVVQVLAAAITKNKPRRAENRAAWKADGSAPASHKLGLKAGAAQSFGDTVSSGDCRDNSQGAQCCSEGSVLAAHPMGLTPLQQWGGGDAPGTAITPVLLRRCQ